MTASNGESSVLCSVDSPSNIRVSRYGVNLEELDRFVEKLPSMALDKTDLCRRNWTNATLFRVL